MRDGDPLPSTTPPVVISQLAYRVFGPLRPDRVRTMLDYHGLAGHPAADASSVADRHGISTRTLSNWSKTLTTAGSRLPLHVELATELARASRPGEDHLSRVRAATTLGLAAPRPPILLASAPSPTTATGASQSDRAAAGIATRILAAVGPLSLRALHLAITRTRRSRSLPPITSEQFAAVLTAAGATRDDEDKWRAPDDATAPDRYRALVAIAAGRDLTRQEMIDALRTAGYAQTSASAKKINNHPLIYRDGPNRYRLLGDCQVESRAERDP